VYSTAIAPEKQGVLPFFDKNLAEQGIANMRRLEKTLLKCYLN